MTAVRAAAMPDDLAEIRRCLADAWVAGADSAPATHALADMDLAAYRAEARLTAALAAYEQARTDGLCFAGAWECALAIVYSSTSSLIVPTPD